MGYIGNVYFSDFWLGRDREREGSKQRIVDAGDEDLIDNWEEDVCDGLRLFFSIKGNEFNHCRIISHLESERQ